MKALIGVVCDVGGVAPATVAAVVRGITALQKAGREVELAIKPAAGQPDIARCLLVGQALAGQFDVLCLVDSGAACVGSGIADLCEDAALRHAIVGTLLPPVLEEAHGEFRAVSCGLTAYSRTSLAAVAEAAPKTRQGFPAVFLPQVMDTEADRVLFPSGWAFCLAHENITGKRPEVLHDLVAVHAHPTDLPAPKRCRSEVREVSYPLPRLPVSRYLAELAEVAGRLKPDGDRRALTEPPPRLEMPAPERRKPGRIRVSLVSTCLLAGGAERQTCTLATALAPDRFEVSVVNAAPEKGAHRPLLDMLEAAKVPCYEGADHPSIDGADVVLWWGPSLRRKLAKNGIATPTIHVAHSDSHWTAQALVECRKYITAAVGVSGPAAAMVEDVLGLEPGTVPVIWNGIDHREFENVKRRTGPGFVVGWLGRLSDEKNPIAPVAALVHLPADVRLDMWGDGPLRDFVGQAAAELGVSERVTLHGTTTDRAGAFEQMDCLVIPSLFEGLPLTAIEAMLAGVPVIAAAHGDLPLVLEMRGELLLSPSERHLAASVLAVRERGTDTARARAFALEHFTTEAMAANYAALIERLACIN